MPRIIKRYPNRKCYDTETSRYVNLEEIERLVRDEVDIRIIDNETQEDVTAIYLSKIIMSQEKREKDAFTPLFLRQEIQRRSEPIVDAVRKSLEKGTDFLTSEYDEVRRLLGRITQNASGRSGEGENGISAPVVKELLSFLNLRERRLAARIEERVREFIKDYGVPSRRDIEELERKIDDLAKAIEKLS